MKTKIIRSLTNSECKTLIHELRVNDSLWTSHSTENTSSLIDGKSIFLQNIGISLNYNYDRFEKFPETYNIMKSVAETRVLARCYWHRLLPNDTIKFHSDKLLTFVIKNQLYARYQIYLNCPNDTENKMLFLDNQWVNPQQYENCIVDFNLKDPHQYANNSDNPWYFLVFDVLKDGIEISR